MIMINNNGNAVMQTIVKKKLTIMLLTKLSMIMAIVVAMSIIEHEI